MLVRVVEGLMRSYPGACSPTRKRQSGERAIDGSVTVCGSRMRIVCCRDEKPDGGPDTSVIYNWCKLRNLKIREPRPGVASRSMEASPV